jgi:hypothetical protein
VYNSPAPKWTPLLGLQMKVEKPDLPAGPLPFQELKQMGGQGRAEAAHHTFAKV